MSGASSNSAAERMLDRRGQSVTLRNFEKTGEDDYGPDYAETTGSPYSVQMMVDTPASLDEVRDAFGMDIDEARTFFAQTGTTATSEITGGGGDGASEIDHDGETWIVLSTTTQDSGLTRLVTARRA